MQTIHLEGCACVGARLHACSCIRAYDAHKITSIQCVLYLAEPAHLHTFNFIRQPRVGKDSCICFKLQRHDSSD